MRIFHGTSHGQDSIYFGRRVHTDLEDDFVTLPTAKIVTLANPNVWPFSMLPRACNKNDLPDQNFVRIFHGTSHGQDCIYFGRRVYTDLEDDFVTIPTAKIVTLANPNVLPFSMRPKACNKNYLPDQNFVRIFNGTSHGQDSI